MKVKIYGRLAFANLHQPNTKFEKPRFDVSVIVDPDSKSAADLAAAVEKVASEKWKDKAPGVLKQLRKQDRVCYREEPKLNKEGDVYPGFEGMHFVDANNPARPTLLDTDKTPLVESDGKPYSGCYAWVIVDLWAQDSPQWGQRINASLLGVQFAKDGDSFGGAAPASADDFDELDAGDNDLA